MRAGAKLVDRGELWDAVAYEGRLNYRDAKGKISLPLPRMAGSHQADNAALAIAMLRHQSAITVPESALAAAMEWTKWPARMQRLGAGPLTAVVPNAEIWLDGGHNLDAARQIRKFMEQHSAEQNNKFNVIVGMLANKDADTFLREIAPFASSVRAVPVPNHDHHNPFDLAIKATRLGVRETGTAPNIEIAVEETERHIRPGENYAPILIVGSLYLAGEVLKANNQIPD
jgi:dihydrofolate synthase/folylpolyglutamate synthase